MWCFTGVWVEKKQRCGNMPDQRGATFDLTLRQLDDAGDNDDDKSSHLGIGENVLNSGSPLDISSVDER